MKPHTLVWFTSTTVVNVTIAAEMYILQKAGSHRCGNWPAVETKLPNWLYPLDTDLSRTIIITITIRYHNYNHNHKLWLIIKLNRAHWLVQITNPYLPGRSHNFPWSFVQSSTFYTFFATQPDYLAAVPQLMKTGFRHGNVFTPSFHHHEASTNTRFSPQQVVFVVKFNYRTGLMMGNELAHQGQFHGLKIITISCVVDND